MVVGGSIGVGSNKKSLSLIKSVNFKILLVPASVITGTYIGVSVFSLLQDNLSLIDSLAVGSGFGYYSLLFYRFNMIINDRILPLYRRTNNLNEFGYEWGNE